jgi:TolB-like protein
VNPPEADVRAELERILASKGFASAGRLSRLLRYVVDKTIAGEANQLKEYAVGVEVFDRDASYDPRLDSIVRVEAGRLRGRLEEYYAGDGASSAIRISLPRGGYVAHFSPASPVAPDAPPHPRTSAPASLVAWPLTVGLVCAVAAMVVWLGGWNRTPPTTGPSVAVLAFDQYLPSSDDAALAAQFTASVTTELARLGTVGVASHTGAMQFAGKRRSLQEIADTLKVEYVVEAEVEREPNGVLVALRLVDVATNRKFWVMDYRGAESDVRGISQRIAFDVSTELLRRAR